MSTIPPGSPHPARPVHRGVRVGLPAALAAGLVLVVSGSGCAPAPGSDVREAIERGRFQEAWRRASEAVAADSSSVAAWKDLARAALATDRTVQGLAAAERARQLAPADPEPLLLRAYLDQRRRRNTAAVAAADSARELVPGDARAQRAAGELRLGGGMVGVPDYDGAERAFRAATALDPVDVRARFGLGMVLVFRGRSGEGVPWLDGVLAERPAHGEAHYLLGLAYMRAHDFEAALACFDSAVAFEPSHAAASFNRARMLDRLGRHDEAVAARQRSEIVRDLVERERLAAEKWHANGDISSGVAYARTLRHAGQWGDAMELSRTLVAEFPRLPATHLELAEAAWAQCVPEAARRAAADAVALSPNLQRAYLLDAYAAEKAGDREGAVESARAAVELDPGEPEAAALLAHLLVAAGSPAQAIATLDEAVRRGARDIRVAGARAEALLALGREDEAEPLLSRMIRTQRTARWLELRARARQASGRLGPACDDLRAALDLEPRRSEAWRMLVDVLEAADRKGEMDECRERADRCRREEAAADEALSEWAGAPFEPATAARAVDALVAAGRTVDAGRVTRLGAGFGLRP